MRLILLVTVTFLLIVVLTAVITLTDHSPGPILPLYVFAADGQTVSITEGPPPIGYQQILNYNGSNQLISVCFAQSNVAGTNSTRSRIKVSIAGVSKASPAVVTSSSHGFALSSHPQLTISGATGTGWTAINSTWTATPIDANTFSIPIDSTSFGTLGGTITFTTTAPRMSVEEWAVQELSYDGSGNLIWKGWLEGSSALQAKCSDSNSTTIFKQ